MRLTKIPFVALILIARTRGGEILIPIPGQDESTARLVDDLINIVKSCYGDRIGTIGLAGDLPHGLLRRLSTQRLIPVALMDGNYIDRNDGTYPNRRISHALQVFVIEASTFDDIAHIVERNLRRSVWWNHMAFFFILDRSPGCANASYLLFAAWMMNILNAKVLCYHHRSGRVIVNYNPYTDEAPDSWQLVDDGRNSDFTLFTREYRGDEAICVDLDFDKTRDLGGELVLINGIGNPGRMKTRHPASADPHWLKHERILRMIIDVLNIRPNFRNVERFDDPVWRGSIAQISLPLIANDHIMSTAYPHEQVTFVIVSQFRDYAPRLNKVDLGFVCLITLVALKFIVHQASMSAIRRLMRLTRVAGFRGPDRSSWRIYLAGLLLFAVTMQAVCHGNLTFRLTKRSPYKNVETLEDLVSFGYRKIYVYDNQKSVVMHPELRKRFVIAKSNDVCFTRVMRDASAACIWRTNDARHLGRVFGLHVSSEPFAMMNYGFPIERHLPYGEKINEILATCAEAGILETWPMQCNMSHLNDFRFGTFGEKVDTRSIDLREMKFAFMVLGIGLACATVTLVLESVIRYKCVQARRL